MSAVKLAKSAASAKGANAVGALKSEEFASLTAGSYVIYSGVYHKQAEAQKALRRAEEELPGAKVIKCPNSASSAPAARLVGGSSSSGAGGRKHRQTRCRIRAPKSLEGAKGKNVRGKVQEPPQRGRN